MSDKPAEMIPNPDNANGVVSTALFGFRWTPLPPREKGWYWMDREGDDEPRVVYVEDGQWTWGHFAFVIDVKCRRWAGPIPSPDGLDKLLDDSYRRGFEEGRDGGPAY